MKIKISELQGSALDWAVAKCEGVSANFLVANQYGGEHFYQYSNNWLSGGPIIEREEIALEPMTHDKFGDGWLATRVEGPAVCMEFGPTMLTAAMRCYVVGILGEEVEVPDGL